MRRWGWETIVCHLIDVNTTVCRYNAWKCGLVTLFELLPLK
jgi:hypothetical protein